MPTLRELRSEGETLAAFIRCPLSRNYYSVPAGTGETRCMHDDDAAEIDRMKVAVRAALVECAAFCRFR